MRELINSTFITLDGAVENPHRWPSPGKAGSDLSFEIQDELLHACDGSSSDRRQPQHCHMTSIESRSSGAENAAANEYSHHGLRDSGFRHAVRQSKTDPLT